MIERLLVAAVLGPLLAGCGDSRSLIAQSCSGQPIPNCAPYEYSEITNASLAPAGLYALQTARANIRISMNTCGAAKPQRHDVSLEAIIPLSNRPDGGGEQRTVSLGSFRDDGTRGDPRADDSSIEITITNPFVGTTIPNDTEVTLRFRSSSIRGAAEVCSSPAVDIPYRTGRPL